MVIVIVKQVFGLLSLFSGRKKGLTVLMETGRIYSIKLIAQGPRLDSRFHT